MLPPPKTFKPKHPLPVLIDYSSDPGPEFWDQFPKNHVVLGKSTICPEKLRNLAWSVGYTDSVMLDTVCKDLSEGANIGCTGQHRQATFSGNAPSAYEFAEQVTDSVADWILAGFAAGHLTHRIGLPEPRSMV